MSASLWQSFRREERRETRGQSKYIQWRRMFPYGRWTCADGREVLFNRDYVAILERLPGEQSKAITVFEWVEFIKQEWFYTDSTPQTVRRKRVNAVLQEWGLPEVPRKPKDPGLYRASALYPDRETDAAWPDNPWSEILSRRALAATN